MDTGKVVILCVIVLCICCLLSSAAGGVTYAVDPQLFGSTTTASSSNATAPPSSSGTAAPASTVASSSQSAAPVNTNTSNGSSSTTAAPTTAAQATAVTNSPAGPSLVNQPLKWASTQNGTTFTRYLDCLGGACSQPLNTVEIWQGSGAAGQQWSWANGGVTSGGHCLATLNNGTANGTSVVAYGSCDTNGGTLGGTGGQQWVWQQATDGNWQLMNPLSGRCLDVSGGVDANGTRVQLWDCNSSWSRWLPVAFGK